MRRRAYVDSSVWIAAHRGPVDVRSIALDVITSPEWVIVTSAFVALEVYPMAEYHRRYEEVAFTVAFSIELSARGCLPARPLRTPGWWVPGMVSLDSTPSTSLSPNFRAVHRS